MLDKFKLIEREKTKFRLRRFKKPKKKRKTKVIKKYRISVDIGSKSIKLVEGMYDGKVVIIKNLATIATPKDSYSDGDIIDVEAIESAIETIINRTGIKSKEIIYTIESKSIISREVEFPSVDDKDIKQMMNYQVEECFPVNLDEYIVQSKVVEQVNTEEKKKSKLSVSILPKEMCEGYLNLTEVLSLKPIALDMNDNSIHKLLSENFISSGDEEYLQDKTISILDIGHNVTNIIIMESGIFRFSRLIEFGGKDISRNVEQSLGITKDEAEYIKINIGNIFVDNENMEIKSTTDYLNSVRKVIQNSLSELCIEVEKIFKYHISRSSSNKINELYIYGATSRMIGIDKFMEDTLNIPTYKIDTLENIKLVKKYRDTEIIQYANAIGAIMRM